MTAESGVPGPGVSLNKLTLTKSAPAVSLSKQGSGGGRLRVNLNWNAWPASKGGCLKGLTRGGALDLARRGLYELADGAKGVVQALGNAFGALDRPPFIQLDADDR